jgi:hypothetical protein
MDNAEQQAARRAKLTEIAISADARENAILTANSAAATYQQAVADRSTAQLNLDRTIRAQSDPHQRVRRQQRNVVAGGAIYLDEVTYPEILDPRRVEGQHFRVSVPGMFYEGSRASSIAIAPITRMALPDPPPSINVIRCALTSS